MGLPERHDVVELKTRKIITSSWTIDGIVIGSTGLTLAQALGLGPVGWFLWLMQQ